MLFSEKDWGKIAEATAFGQPRLTGRLNVDWSQVSADKALSDNSTMCLLLATAMNRNVSGVCGVPWNTKVWNDRAVFIKDFVLFMTGNGKDAHVGIRMGTLNDWYPKIVWMQGMWVTDDQAVRDGVHQAVQTLLDRVRNNS